MSFLVIQKYCKLYTFDGSHPLMLMLMLNVMLYSTGDGGMQVFYNGSNNDYVSVDDNTQQEIMQNSKVMFGLL